MNDFLQNNSRKMWRDAEEGRLDPDNSLLDPDVGNMGSTIHFFAFIANLKCFAWKYLKKCGRQIRSILREAHKTRSSLHLAPV